MWGPQAQIEPALVAESGQKRRLFAVCRKVSLQIHSQCAQVQAEAFAGLPVAGQARATHVQAGQI